MTISPSTVSTPPPARFVMLKVTGVAEVKAPSGSVTSIVASLLSIVTAVAPSAVARVDLRVAVGGQAGVAADIRAADVERAAASGFDRQVAGDGFERAHAMTVADSPLPRDVDSRAPYGLQRAEVEMTRGVLPRRRCAPTDVQRAEVERPAAVVRDVEVAATESAR